MKELEKRYTHLFIDKLDPNQSFEGIGRQESKLSVAIFNNSAPVHCDEGWLRRGTCWLCQSKGILFSCYAQLSQYIQAYERTVIFFKSFRLFIRGE